MSITLKNAQKLSDKSEMYRQTTDVDHGAGSESPELQAAALPQEGAGSTLLLLGMRHQGKGGGDSLMV